MENGPFIDDLWWFYLLKKGDFPWLQGPSGTTSPASRHGSAWGQDESHWAIEACRVTV